MHTALYAGSFDPITNGHMSLIRRGLHLFDRIIVGVANQTSNRRSSHLKNAAPLSGTQLGNTATPSKSFPFPG